MQNEVGISFLLENAIAIFDQAPVIVPYSCLQFRGTNALSCHITQLLQPLAIIDLPDAAISGFLPAVQSKVEEVTPKLHRIII